MIGWLRAAGEASRMRLLALCAQGALSVSDLAQALGQSEPRVSRNLKILSEAGLIERQRQGQWVHYRIATTAAAASFVAGLLAQLERRDAQLMHDRAAVRAALALEPTGTITESRLGRALAALVSADATANRGGAVLIVGITHPELLEASASAARFCTALSSSRRSAQAARAYSERRGFACRVLESTGPDFTAAELARAGAPFDVVVLDRPAADEAALLRTLQVARAALSPAGRLWLFEGYESLESAGRVVEHPLARLRRLLSESGLKCERLSPVEADGEHVLAASARPAELPGNRAHDAAGASA